MIMEADALQLQLQRCLDLQNGGGGRVVVHYDPEVFTVNASTHPSWIVEHHEMLNTMTLDVPSHGAFCLMHPGVLAWEMDRDDFRPMEETA